MKRFAISFIILSGIVFTLNQCKSADAGTKVADTFFSLLLKGEFENAASMVELPIGDTTDIVTQIKRLENNPANGQLKSFNKSMGFKTNISNGITTIQLQYTLTYDKGEKKFNVVIENKGVGYKIVSVR